MISGWTSSYGQSNARRSHDQPQGNTSSRSRSSSPDTNTGRRSSNEATPRQTPAPNPRYLASAATQDSEINVLGNSSGTEVLNSASRRLGFFSEKLSSSQHSGGSGFTQSSRSASKPSQLLQPGGHSRAESAFTVLSRDNASSPVPSAQSNISSSAANSNLSKLHNSPSKQASSGRTYDSKLVSREMQRLGNLAHLPSSLTPSLTAASSATSLPIPMQSSHSTASVTSVPSGENPWASLHVHVLPLFNGEPLRRPIEDLNVLVKRHIQAVVSQSPSKALATLSNDASELIASGMITLNAKLVGIEDEKLVGRVVEIWGFFWDQILPYVEGVLLPLQTDSILSSLYRTPKGRRPSSPTHHTSKVSMSSMTSLQQTSSHYIDVRTVALKSFRDSIIVPLFTRLYALFSMPDKDENFQETAKYQLPRLQQMFLVLVSQDRQLLPSLSLTELAPQPTTGEAAVSELLLILRSPRVQIPISHTLHSSSSLHSQRGKMTRAPTFLSGGLPRDRRGRIAQKQNGKVAPSEPEDHVEEENVVAFGDGGDTPRNGLGAMVMNAEREREREFLEALRSPDPEDPGARASIGGWGLGAGHEHVKLAEEDDEDETTWDDAQAVVERMVGMKPSDNQPDIRRRPI